MLKIDVPGCEFYDEREEVFVNTKSIQLSLEHSLVSISKWEAIYCKPFLSDAPKTEQEVIDYIKCMTLTQNVDPDVYKCIPSEELIKIKNYIEAPMTATTISGGKQQHNKKQILTSELIYYYMIAYQIPFECQKWHLNRLMMLIQVCDAKNQDPKKNKMSVNDVRKQNASLNAARRKAMGTKG